MVKSDEEKASGYAILMWIIEKFWNVQKHVSTLHVLFKVISVPRFTIIECL